MHLRSDVPVGVAVSGGVDSSAIICAMRMLEKDMPIHVSNVAFYDNVSNKGVRIGFSFDKDYKDYPCKCHSKNCCGYIVRAGSRFRINKKFAISKKKTNKSL